MNKLIWITLATLIFSCNDSGTTSSSTGGGNSNVDTSPIYLQDAFSLVTVSDYLGSRTLDSVSVSAGLKAGIGMGGTQVRLVNTGDRSLGNLRLWSKEMPTDVPVLITKKTKSILSLPDPQRTYSKVAVKGEFNAWNPDNNPMNYNPSTKAWETQVATTPGKFQYKFVADAVEVLDNKNMNLADNGMGGNNHFIEVPAPAGTAPKIRYSNRPEGNLIKLKLENTPRTLEVYYRNQLLTEANVESSASDLQIKVPAGNDDQIHMIRIYAGNAAGLSNQLAIPIKNGAPVTAVKNVTRQDFHNNILYFMMVDRFVDGDPGNTRKLDDPEVHPKANYYGGDLQGVYETLATDYFDNLGVNTIWLSPITQNPDSAYGLWPNPRTKFSGYHGYWPISSTQIDDRMGTPDVLEKLIDESHDRDMNVILDYVANHVHEEHPVYKQHPDWATNLYLEDGSLNTERWDDQRLTTWFDTFMPTLDFSKPEVVEKMTDSALYWVTRYDLDGYRHDATKHVPEAYWRTLTRKVRENVDRPIYQIGETYGSPELIRSYVSTGMLDAQFDFNMYDAAVNAFAKAETPLSDLGEALQKSLKYYGDHHLMGNISGNQDRPRFMTYASGDLRFDQDAKKVGWTTDVRMSDERAYDKLALLHAYNMFIPGLPVIYYGDEYGAIGAGDPDNRRWMRFDDQRDSFEKDLAAQVAKLTRARTDNLVLLYGTTQIVKATEDVLIIKRRYFKEEAYLIINKGERTVEFILDEKKENVKQVLGAPLADTDELVQAIVPTNKYTLIIKSN